MEIVDQRVITDFSKTTFCGHTRTHVISVLSQNIELGHADYAGYWTMELLSSGLVHTLWAVFFGSAAKHINRAQPNVFFYLAEMYEKYVPLEEKYPIRQMTDIRNNTDVRRIVCEVAATLALCRKSKLPSFPTIKPVHDFNPITIQEYVRAPSTLFGQLVLRPSDPLPCVVPVNEFCYSLRADVRDMTRCLYWAGWIFAFCKEHKKQTKLTISFADRSDDHVSKKDGEHPVWILWDAVRKQANPAIKPLIETMYKMYALRWSTTTKPYLLISAVQLVCDGNTFDQTPVNGKTMKVEEVLNGMSGWIHAIVEMRKSLA